MRFRVMSLSTIPAATVPRPHRLKDEVRWPPVTAIAGATILALAAWVSLGVIAVSRDATSSRVGLLPGWWVPALVFAVLMVAACWRRIPHRLWVPALVPTLLLLPWLPVRVPAALLVWTGPVVGLVWSATAAAFVLASGIELRLAALRRAFSEPRRAAWFACSISLLVFALVSWVSAPARPGGDEPHYLIIAQSIILDGDLKIENNHAREDYAAYFSGSLKPDFLRRGKNGQIYSIHAPGLPILVAPAFAAGGYPAVVVFLVFVSALGALLVWRTSYAVTGSAGAAWFAWAAVMLSAPILCHAGAVYPDGPSAVFVMAGVAALVRLEHGTHSDPGTRHGNASRHDRTTRWWATGIALAALPWLHTRAAAAAGVLGMCIGLRLAQRRMWSQLAAFLAIPIVSAIGWFAFFHAIYGNYSPTAPYGSYSQSSFLNMWPGLPALFLDQQYGIIPNAPVYAIALAGLPVLFAARRRLAVELTALLVVYVAAVTSYHMWWGGWSAPARFAVPVLLALAPGAAAFWVRAGTTARAGALAALAVSMMAGFILTTVAGGRLMFNWRDGIARWLEWLCPLVDLPRALPSFFRGTPWEALGAAGAWLVVMGAAWLALRFAALRSQITDPIARRGRLAAATSLLFAAGVMVAATVVWTVQDVSPVTPTSAQLRLLSVFDSDALPVGLQFRPPRFREPADLVSRLRLSVSERRPPAVDASLLTLQELPAGDYRLVRALRDVARRVDVRIFKSPAPIRSCDFEAREQANCIIHLPVTVRELHVVAAAPTLPTSRAFELQPLNVLAARERPTLMRASAGARYGSFTAFAFDSLVFLEPAGLWVTGGVETAVVLASDVPRPAIPILLRNGAAPNMVHLRTGGVQLDVRLAAREEREITLPLEARSQASFLRIRTDRGFKPSETEPGSRDQRFLGAWIEMGER